MAFHPTAFKRLIALAAFAGVTLGRSWGQEAAPDSPITFDSRTPVTVTMVAPPSLGSPGASQAQQQPGEDTQWLKVEFHYAVKPQPNAPSPFVDSVTFNVTIEGRDLYAADATSPDGVPVGLTGSATYINLSESRDVYGAFYVHPSTLKRYSTKLGVSDFTSDKFNVHIEAQINGKTAAIADLRKDPEGPDWIKGLRLTPGFVYRQDQCCFIVNDPSYYPELKHPPQAQ